MLTEKIHHLTMTAQLWVKKRTADANGRVFYLPSVRPDTYSPKSDKKRLLVVLLAFLKLPGKLFAGYGRRPAILLSVLRGRTHSHSVSTIMR